MTTTGPNYPSTVSQSSSPLGSLSWFSITNAAAEDGSYASAAATATSQFTHYIKCVGFGFAVTASDTVLGIEAEWKCYKTGGFTWRDYSARLVLAGTISGLSRVSGTAYPSSNAWQAARGGSTDTWGNAGLTGSDINSSTFGIAVACQTKTGSISGTAFFDAIRLTVYHAVPPDFHSRLVDAAIVAGDLANGGLVCKQTRLLKLPRKRFWLAA